VRPPASGSEPLGRAEIDRLTGDYEPDRQQALPELDHLAEAPRRQRSHRRPVLDALCVRGRGELERDRVGEQARFGGQALGGNAELSE